MHKPHLSLTCVIVWFFSSRNHPAEYPPIGLVAACRMPRYLESLLFQLLTVLSIPLRVPTVLFPCSERIDYDCHARTLFAFGTLRPMNRRRPSSPLSRFSGGHAFLLKNLWYSYANVSIYRHSNHIKRFNLGFHLNFSLEL